MSTRSIARGLASSLLALCLLSQSSSALGFCRTRTCEFRQDVDCPIDGATGCSTVGEFVFWDGACISYAVQRDGSAAEDISAAELAQLIDKGFQTWSDVRCPSGGTPELSSTSQGLTSCDEVEYDCNVREANSNVIMFRDQFQNSAYGLRFGVIALTTLTANLVSGELFDADIEINSRDEEFSLVGSGNLDPNEPRDLRGVINHELGHLLGLSHSTERGALMRAQYEGSFAPGEDDIRAMCQALGATGSDPECAAQPLPVGAGCVGSDTMCTSQRAATDSGGCSCEVPASGGHGGHAAWWVAALGAIGCFSARAATRRSRRRAACGA